MLKSQIMGQFTLIILAQNFYIFKEREWPKFLNKGSHVFYEKKKQHIFEWSEIEKYRFYQIIEFHWILKSSSIVVETFHTPILYSIKLLWELQFC